MRTTFTICFPLQIMEKENSRKIERTLHAPRRKKVLVVDDEQIVRELLTGILAPNGYEVLTASDGPGALELSRVHGDTIDVVFLDMVMAGMKRDDLLNALDNSICRTRVIISTGFMSKEQRERLANFRIEGFLDKPHKDKEVLRVMTSLFPEGAG